MFCSPFKGELVPRRRFEMHDEARDLRENRRKGRLEGRRRRQEVFLSAKVANNIHHAQLPHALTATHFSPVLVVTAPHADGALAGALECGDGVGDGG